MSDTSRDEAPAPSNDPLFGLRELANSPRLLKASNTQTTVFEFVGRIPASNTASTSIMDVRGLAETVMFDATRLVARLDELAPHSNQIDQVTLSEADRVSVAVVLRGGAVITAAFAVLCLVGTQFTGAVLLHPLLAWFLILGSLGFYLMAKVRH
jgi:hypothetical protein